MAAFDLIANNADRKSGHCLLDREGRIWAIDNGLSFHVEPKLRTVIWDFAGDTIEHELLDSLEPLSRAGLPGVMSSLLDEEEIAALLARAADAVARAVFRNRPGSSPTRGLSSDGRRLLPRLLVALWSNPSFFQQVVSRTSATLTWATTPGRTDGVLGRGCPARARGATSSGQRGRGTIGGAGQTGVPGPGPGDGRGLASRLGFTYDQVEDLRLAIDEICFGMTGSKGRDGMLELHFLLGPTALVVQGRGPLRRAQPRSPIRPVRSHP